MEAVATHQPETTFDCEELGLLTLSVGAPTAAQELTGVSYRDTGDPGPGEPCAAMRIEAPIRIASADASLSFEPQAYTAKYSCSDANFEGTVQDPQGRSLTFMAFSSPVEGSNGELTVQPTLVALLSDAPHRIDCRAIER